MRKKAKYRIKIRTYQTGRATYTPAFKSKIGWLVISYSGIAHILNDDSCSTREEALNLIDKHFNGDWKRQSITFEYINK